MARNNIEMKIDVATKQAQKSISDLANSFSNLKNSIKGSLENTDLSSFQKKVSKFGLATGAALGLKGFKERLASIEKLRDKIYELNSENKRMNELLNEDLEPQYKSAKLAKMVAEWKNLSLEIKKAKKELEDFYALNSRPSFTEVGKTEIKPEFAKEYTKKQKQLLELQDKSDRLGSKIDTETLITEQKMMDQILGNEQKIESFNNQLSILETGLGKPIGKIQLLVLAIRGVYKAFSTVFTVAKRVIKQFLTLGGVTKKLAKSFRSISHVLKYMLLRMMFRQVIKNAKNNFDSLIQISDELRESFNKLYNAIIKVGNAFVSAFGPAIQALSPIVANLFNAMSNLLDIMSQFNTVLFLNGDYYYRAKDTALDYAETLEKGGKAAKKSLAPFDKINKLDTNKGGGSTNADDLLSPQDKFEQAPVEEIIKNFVQRFKNALFTGEGTEFGYSIGTWLTEQFRKGLELTDVNAAGVKIAPKIRGLVTTINGIMYGADWSMLGRTIANMLNIALFSGLLILKTFDFSQAGVALGQVIMGVFNNFDWKTFGVTAATFVNQIINYVFSLFTTIDWGSIGFDFSNSVNSFLKTFDAKKVGQTVSEVLNSILNLFITFLGNLDWMLLGEEIGEFLVSIDWLGILTRLFIVISEILAGLGYIIITGLAKIIAEIILWLFDIAKEFLKVGESILEWLLTPFEFLKDLLILPFKIAWNAIKNLFTGELSPKELGNNIIDGLLEPFSKLKEKLLEPFKTAYNGVLEFFDVHSPSKLLKKLGKFLMQGFNGGMDEEGADMSPMTNIYGDMEEGTIKMTDNMLVTWNSFTESLKELWDGIHNLIVAEVNFGVTALNEMIKAMELGMNAAIRSMNKAIRAYNAAAEETGGRRLSTLSTVALSKIPIPKLATGAVIPPNSEFLAILGDQKHGTNIEAPLETIMEALDRVLDKRGNNSNQPIIIELDDRELGRAIGDIQNRENRRIGSRLVYN